MGKREAGTIYISLQLATDELRAGIRTLDQEFKKIGNTAQQVGQKLSLAFSLPLAAVGRSAVKSFGDFDQAMQNSLAIMGKVSDTMKRQLVEGAMKVASTTKFSATEAAEGYYDLVSAGLSAAQALKALPIAADFATAGNIGLAQATQTLTRVQAAFGLSSNDAQENMKGMARVADVVARASIDTTLHIDELSNALASQLSGALRQSHTSIETATAVLEAFGQQNITGAKAGTALGIVVRELGIDFLKHAKAFKQMGVEVFDASGNYKNIIDIIGSLEKKFVGLSDAQKLAALLQLGFTKRNAQYIQMLIGWSAQMKEFEKRNYAAAGSIQQIAEVMKKGFNQQMAMAMHNIQNVAIVIGAELAPYVVQATQVLVKLAELFLMLPDPIRHTAEALLLISAALGPLTYVFGILSSGFSALLALFGLLLKPIQLLIEGIGILVATFGGMPVAIAAAVVAAVAAVVVFWDDIKGLVSDFIDWFSSTFPEVTVVMEAAWILVKEAAAATWDFIQKAAEAVFNWLKDGFQFLMDVASAAWKGIGTLAGEAWQAIKDTVSGFVTWFAEAFPGTTKVFSEAWTAMKNIVSGVIDEMIGMVKTLIGWIQSIFEALGEAKDWVVGKSKEIVAGAAQNDAAKVIADTAKAQIDLNAAASQSEGIISRLGDIWAKAKGYIHDTGNEQDNNTSIVKQNTDALGKNAEGLDQTLKGFEGVDKGAKKAASAIDQLNKKLLEAKDKNVGKSIEEQLDNAIQALDKGAFDRLSAQLAESVKKGSDDGLKDLVAKAGAANAEAAQQITSQIGQAKADTEVSKWKEKWDDASAKGMKEMQQKQEEAHKNAVDFWRDSFSAAIDGSSKDLKTSLKDLLVGFAAELAASVSGGMKEGIKGFGDIGGLIAKGLEGLFGYGTSATGGTAGGSGSGLAGAAVNAGATYMNASGSSVTPPDGAIGQNADGTFMMPDGSSQAGTTGSSTFGAIAGYGSAGVSVIGAGINASKTDKKNGDNSGTGGAVGAGAGAIVGGIYGGPMGAAIGAQLGQVLGAVVGSLFKRGSQDPETKARHAFANYIEESFAKLKTVSFFDAKGKLEQFKGDKLNFLEGDPTKFSDPHWADKLNGLGNTARATFLGLGDALKETLGLTDAVGSHIAELLVENLGGNVDNARLLVQQLGLSMDDMIDKLVQVGLTGSKSWLEIETDIQGVTEAFKPGLVAVGDIKGAFQELIDSGGRGVVAIKAVKDIAVEAMEAGAKTLEDLKGRLLQQGVNPADVDALMNALKQRGITTLQQLADVSNRVGGGIVADINASSKTMADTWADMAAKLDDVSQKLQDLPTQIESNIMLNVDANISSSAQQVIDSGVAPQVDLPTTGTKKFAKGGLINRAIGFRMGSGGFGIAGEAGPEFLMPAHMMPDGSLGVRAMGGRGASGNPVNISVYAPNATPGMENKIVDAIKRAQGQIVSQTLDVLDRQQSRGGRYS